MCAGRAGELDRGGADAARATVHEQPLAGTQLRLREERVVGGREDLRQTCGGGPVQNGGNRHQLPLVDDGQLGLPAPTDDRHDAVAEREPLRSETERCHLAGELHAGDVLRRARWRGVEPTPLHHVGAVEPRGAHPHEHLARPGNRVGVLLKHELLLADGDGAHGWEPTRRRSGAPGRRPP